ncbi:MAG: STAS domain-containing protein [Bacteroidota bacterium]|jgi:anti-sigma B factor antagonist|nr:STAS domain-containing protein [Bacteroidota bacterium]
MQIKETIDGDVVVLALKGNLMGDPETTEFRDKIKSLVRDGFLKIVLDVSKVKWINSSGLGALISALATVNNAGGDLRIANVTEKINSLFMITQLIKVFKSFETIERAIASFLVDPISGTPAGE